MRDFRSEQTKYLQMVKEGVEIILKSRTEGSFKLTPVTEDDSLMSKEEYFKMLDQSIQEAKEGKVHSKREGETIEQFIDRITSEQLEE